MDCAESWIIAKDGTRLQVRRFTPLLPRAWILHVHGFGEHSRRFNHVIEVLLEAGFGVLTYDQRGHGRSDGKRGDIPQYDLFLDDLDLIWQQLPSSLPRFIYGHSFGGQLVLQFALHRHPAADGLVLSSPWLDLAYQPPAYKLFLANLLRRVWPGFIQKTGVKPQQLSEDTDFIRNFEDAHLVHRWISIRTFFGIVERAEELRSAADRIDYPMLLLHGEEDPLTCPKASQAFFAASPSRDKTLKLYPGLRHETHNEPERMEVLRDIVDWITARSVSPTP